MYCTSSAFLKKMRVYIDEIEKKSEGILTFVEYIPLPYFGNATLRFDINRENYTLLDVNEFIVDFMGSVYQKVGFEPCMYEERFRKCYQKYSDIPVDAREYQELLHRDAISLLQKCGLSDDAKVWEIQIEDDISLFILGEANRKIGTYVIENNTIHVFEVEKIPCFGLMRASIYAKMQHISMVRVLLEV